MSNETHELDDAGLVAGLGRHLKAANLPLDRLTLHLRTLHPEILGRTIAWAPNEPIEIRDRAHGIAVMPTFVDSPLWHVMQNRQAATVSIGEAEHPAWVDIDVFRGRRLRQFIMVPLTTADGPVSAVCFATASPRGFSAQHVAMLERIQPALRSVSELRALRSTELALLDTYVGTGTAQRILAGRIRRGQVESLEAALVLCDLHNFTTLSNHLPAAEVLKVLDRYFDRMLPAIAENGGEVLKFMGDAALAFFHNESAEACCAAALNGARLALQRLEADTADPKLTTSIALHYGKVSYGNIGSGSRLDFTLIGPDVNLVSRIQGLCGPTEHSLLMSERFATHIERDAVVGIGKYPMKGFEEPQPLYSLK
ncbi:MAG TPA: adenylate/guanylate cyclase domain-containing protein [Dongiaceae bacterium]